MHMCLPWFEGSDYAWCAVASRFTVLRDQGVVHETFDVNVEGLVEDAVTRHFSSSCLILRCEIVIVGRWN